MPDLPEVDEMKVGGNQVVTPLLARKQLRGTDELWTPEHALLPLLPYLPKTIWECAAGSGLLAIHLRKHGHDVMATTDDFLHTPPQEAEAIVTNPPYSLKTQFLERAYELNMPFAMLLPITALEGIKRQELYRNNGLQILFLPKRIDFTGKKAPWFAVAWFTHGLNLPQDITFTVSDLGLVGSDTTTKDTVKLPTPAPTTGED
jgi:hypothetical protein